MSEGDAGVSKRICRRSRHHPARDLKQHLCCHPITAASSLHSDIINPPDSLALAENTERPVVGGTAAGETRVGLALEASERVPEREVSISGMSSSELSLHAS